MRIIDEWQYKYIERCMYNYHLIQSSSLATERQVVVAIEDALNFFEGTAHETMMVEFYFNADKYRVNLTNSGHFRWICEDIIHTEEPNGYVMRREIIYRVAMNCYMLGVFKKS